MAKLKVVHKWVGLGQVQSFMLILGGSGWIKKIGPTSNSDQDNTSRIKDLQRLRSCVYYDNCAGGISVDIFCPLSPSCSCFSHLTRQFSNASHYMSEKLKSALCNGF